MATSRFVRWSGLLAAVVGGALWVIPRRLPVPHRSATVGGEWHMSRTNGRL
jgi:hypothetical protein